jgi:hypothetical protein
MSTNGYLSQGSNSDLLGKLFASQSFKAFIVGAVVGLVVLLLLYALWTPTLPKSPVLFTVYRLLGAPTRLLDACVHW